MSVEPLRPSKNPTIRIGLILFAAVAIAVLGFSDAIIELLKRWRVQEEYSHGFLIPFISAWMLWIRRDAVLAGVGHSSWTGPVIVLVAILVHVVGEYSSLFILSHLSFILVLVGLVLAIGGVSLLRVTFVPIAFLIFSIPLPYFIESKLTLELQLISSQIGVDVIRMFQIPVYLEGNIIDLGYYKLQVVEACSGLRYLYPLLSLSFLAAYLFQAPIWQRVLVFLSGIPITIVMNGFRIGMVGVTVDRWGPQMADDVLHFFEGWVIFIACAAFLMAEIFLLARLSGTRFGEVFHLSKLNQATSPAQRPSAPTSQLALVSCLVLLCAGALAVHSISHRLEISPRTYAFCGVPIQNWRLARSYNTARSSYRPSLRIGRLYSVGLQQGRRQTGQPLRRLL